MQMKPRDAERQREEDYMSAYEVLNWAIENGVVTQQDIALRLHGEAPGREAWVLCKSDGSCSVVMTERGSATRHLVWNEEIKRDVLAFLHGADQESQGGKSMTIESRPPCPICRPFYREHPKGSSGESTDEARLSARHTARSIALSAVMAEAYRLRAAFEAQKITNASYLAPFFINEVLGELKVIAMALEVPVLEEVSPAKGA